MAKTLTRHARRSQPEETITCNEGVARFIKWRERNSAPNTQHVQVLMIRRFIADLGAEEWPVTDITFEMCDDFVNGPDIGKASTRHARLVALRRYFHVLYNEGHCHGNPAALVILMRRNLSFEDNETTKKIPMTEAEVEHIAAHTSGFWKWATQLSYWGGYRLSDICCMEWGSLTTDRIVLWTRKRQDRRIEAPLPHPAFGGGILQTVIMEMIMEHSVHPQYVFPEQRAKYLDTKNRGYLSVLYRKQLEALGIRGKTFHCLRYGFATRLDAEGYKLEEIGARLGHSKNGTDVTKGYIGKCA